MKQKEAAPQENAVSFQKEDLIANSKRLFNQPPEVVAGALIDVNGAITLEKARASIDNYLTRPIKKEGSK